MITVSEDEISQAIMLLLLKDKVLTGGAGALGAAALLSGKLDVTGKKVVIVVSGANIDPAALQQLLENTHSSLKSIQRNSANLRVQREAS